MECQAFCSPSKELYLRIQDFDYELPPELIAASPALTRDASRLLVLDIPTRTRHHASFREISRFLRPRSLVVLNDTRVIPARLLGRKPSGGRVEIFLVRRRGSESWAHINHSQKSWEEMWEVLLRGAGSLPSGASLALEDGVTAQVESRGERGAAVVRFRGSGAGGLLAQAERQGAIPLPPYIEAARKRAAQGELPAIPEVDDKVRYQTVFARAPGAVAAPTAGLHFTEPLLDALTEAGHEIAKITLHVGPGTFRPVEVDDPTQHHMDEEEYEVSAAAAQVINRARAEGRPIVAVGTTVVRTLETLARDHAEIPAGRGATDIFIMPGARFRLVTDLITNFHLPRSTLLMLVAAFAGREAILDAYNEAVRAGYRFYSYGDAMFLTRHEVESAASP
jgi:S-adenosylmethionine:tRNA ribosyltransferase-isomerase